MRVVLFCHSLLSDWNHGNAHFLRGVVARARSRAATTVRVFEPRGRLEPRRTSVAEHGDEPRRASSHAPTRRCAQRRYDLATLDLDEALDGADLVLVHEWNDHALVARIGAHRARRAATTGCSSTTPTTARSPTPRGDGALRPAHYDGVLAFGRVIRDLYLRRAAGPRGPGPGTRPPTPASSARCRASSDDGRPGLDRQLGRRGAHRRAARVPARAGARRSACARRVHGVRYPRATRTAALRGGGHRVRRLAAELPRRREAFARPRDGARAAPALRRGAARHPDDPRRSRRSPAASRSSARPGTTPRGSSRRAADYLVARDGAEMTRHLRALLHDAGARRELAAHGRAHDPRPPHLRAPRRRAAGDLRASSASRAVRNRRRAAAARMKHGP